MVSNETTTTRATRRMTVLAWLLLGVLAALLGLSVVGVVISAQLAAQDQERDHARVVAICQQQMGEPTDLEGLGDVAQCIADLTSEE